jgi:putative transcriptional regulator
VDNLVRELRSERALSQGALGELLGVSRQTVNAIETGKYDPSLPLAIRMARLFGCSVEDLFRLDGPPDDAARRPAIVTEP